MASGDVPNSVKEGMFHYWNMANLSLLDSCLWLNCYQVNNQYFQLEIDSTFSPMQISLVAFRIRSLVLTSMLIDRNEDLLVSGYQLSFQVYQLLEFNRT